MVDPRHTLALIAVYLCEARDPLVGAFEARACATFVWRGEAWEIVLSGDMDGWIRDRDHLTRVAGATLFVAGIESHEEAHLEPPAAGRPRRR